MIPISIKREWSLREVDISKRLLSDDDREYLAPMVEQVEFSIRFSEESQVSKSSELFDPIVIQMYSEAQATYNELTLEIRKAIDRYNDKMVEHAAKATKHTVYLLTKETSRIHRRQVVVPEPDFDVQSVATTSRTSNTVRTSPMLLWAAGVKQTKQSRRTS